MHDTTFKMTQTSNRRSLELDGLSSISCIVYQPPPRLHHLSRHFRQDMWKPLQTNKAHAASSSQPAFASYSPSILQPTPLQLSSSSAADPLIGPLPVSIFARILNHLPVPDIPNVARTSRALAKIVRSDERVWKSRCLSLGLLENADREEKNGSHSMQRSKCEFLAKSDKVYHSF